LTAGIALQNRSFHKLDAEILLGKFAIWWLNFSHRLKAVAILKRLAQANSLPVSRSAKKGELLEVITS